MSEREDELKAQVRKTPLLERLQDCAKRIGNMCAERRGPRLSIPVQHDDDDFYICTTVKDARTEIAEIRTQLVAADAARKHAQEASSKLVEEIRELKRLHECKDAVIAAIADRLRTVETVESVTTWANETFGQATIRVQIDRAKQEFIELLQLQEVDHDHAQLAEEAADVCICLYRVIGTLDPEAINKKMAKNRARKWKVDGNGCAQHVGE